jgi:hypothetical protein
VKVFVPPFSDQSREPALRYLPLSRKSDCYYVGALALQPDRLFRQMLAQGLFIYIGIMVRLTNESTR